MISKLKNQFTKKREMQSLHDALSQCQVDIK